MKVRVLVVEDSITIRKRIIEVLSTDSGLEVVGECGDGKSAIEMCTRLRPDVITLDMMLPVMTGLAATEYIMAHCATPILIVSASTNRGELFRTYDALAAGAVDVLEKPLGNEVDDSWEKKLIATVKMVARIKVITHMRALRKATEFPRSSIASAFRVVVIGASTGGPAALHRLLGALPRDFPLPIVLVIHIADPFAVAFAQWLDGQLPIRVACANDGELLGGDVRVLMAQASRHLVMRGGRMWLDDGPARHSCRPSIDTLFESTAAEMGAATIACLLTGMGKDGAAGLLALRRAGGHTIAQDEATSIVFGMPREAIALGAAAQVLALDDIAPAITRLAMPRGER